MSKPDRGPAVKVPPPIIFLVCIGIAYALDHWLQLAHFHSVVARGFGGLVLLIGLTIAGLSVFQFFRARTHIEPWKPASNLIISGVFRYSRNPIYLAFVICTLGIGLYLGSGLVVLSVLPAVVTLHYLVIVREERYLTARFGQQYIDYCARVRRWL